MKLLGMLLFLVSCASTPQLPELRRETSKILAEFSHYHKKYRGTPAPKIYVGMVESNVLSTPKTLASCRYQPTPHVVISRPIWEKTPIEVKEYILFHELGHCILKRSHNNDLQDGKPSSIMIEAFTNKNFNHYLEFKDFYIHELFGFSE